MKSPQMETFGRFIQQAREGNEAAVVLVREVMSRAAMQAPIVDLLKMATHLYDIYEDLSPMDQPNGVTP